VDVCLNDTQMHTLMGKTALKPSSWGQKESANEKRSVRDGRIEETDKQKDW